MATPTADTYTAAAGARLVRGGRGGPAVPTLIGLWGQSNALGLAPRTDITAAPLSADAGLAAYNAGTFDRVWIWTGSAFSRLQPSVNGQAQSTAAFGAEFGMAVRWMRETSSGNLYLIKNTRGSTAISAFLPAAADMYPTGKTAHQAAEAWLTSNSVTLGRRGMVWIQGEADLGATSSAYLTSLNTLVGAWTSDAMRGASDKVMLWQMHPSSAAWGSGVQLAKDQYAAANSFASAPVLPYYMQGDNLHLNGRGYVQTGYDCATEIFSAPRVLV